MKVGENRHLELMQYSGSQHRTLSAGDSHSWTHQLPGRSRLEEVRFVAYPLIIGSNYQVLVQARSSIGTKFKLSGPV